LTKTSASPALGFPNGFLAAFGAVSARIFPRP
jgi:hypothetical protein